MLFYCTSKVTFNLVESLLANSLFAYFCNVCTWKIPTNLDMTYKQYRALRYLFFKQITQNDIDFWLNINENLPKWTFVHTKNRQRKIIPIIEEDVIDNVQLKTSSNKHTNQKKRNKNTIKNAEQLQEMVVLNDFTYTNKPKRKDLNFTDFVPDIEILPERIKKENEKNIINNHFLQENIDNVVDKLLDTTSAANEQYLDGTENVCTDKLKTEQESIITQNISPVEVNIPLPNVTTNTIDNSQNYEPFIKPQQVFDDELIDALNLGFDEPLVDVDMLKCNNYVEPPVVYNNQLNGNFIQTYINVPFSYNNETYIYDDTFTNFYFNPMTQMWEYIEFPPYYSQINYSTGLIDLNICTNEQSMYYDSTSPIMVEPMVNESIFIDPMYMPMEQIVYNDDPMFNVDPIMPNQLIYGNNHFYQYVPNDMFLNTNYFYPYTHFTPSTMIIEKHIPYFMNTPMMSGFNMNNHTPKQLEQNFNYTPEPRQPLMVQPGDENNFGEIEIDNLSYCYPGNNELSLDRCTFRIKAGEFHVFAGENGAGKSTFIKCLFGMEEGYEGVIAINRRNILDYPKLKGMLAYVADIATFPSYFTTFQYLYHIGTLSGVSPATLKQKILLLLKQFQIPEVKNKNPNSLSMGQKKKVLLIRSLLERAKVLVLDEPAANLDPTTKIQIFDILKKLQLHGITIFISTHLLDDIKGYATNLTLISKGKILHSGDVSSVEFEKISHSFFSERSKGIDADDVISNVLE